MEGNAIRWQKWHVRISFNWREGLVLHNVGYEDGGRLRPVLHRAAIAEMAVPYAEAQVGNVRLVVPETACPEVRQGSVSVMTRRCLPDC